jgi:nucleotide-binding universal stress UspA family protein
MNAGIRTILVAVDFGDASTRALALAGSLAQAVGATLRVLHAELLDAPPYFTQAQLDVLEGEAQANRARAIEFLRAFGAAHVSGPFETVVENRSAADAILHASAGADLIVMGTHGRRGPSRWWLGSVAERVLRETRVPLLVVHATGTALPAASTFREGMLLRPSHDAPLTRTQALTAALASAFGGSVFTLATDEPRQARQATGATWVALPAPTPRSAHWLSHVGEPLVTSCSMPVLFVPEAEEGLTP